VVHCCVEVQLRFFCTRSIYATGNRH
jgi:hypothetical protein